MKNPGVRSLALGLCLCVLYIGYELARASSLALFAARAAGLTGAWTACGGFLLSIATLALYGRGVEVMGASWTLLVSAGGCSAIFLAFAIALSACGGGDDDISWTLVAALFACREAYVTLLGTQIWALLSSELKERGSETSRSWFCLIQGVSCICSAFAGMAAGRMATSGGHVYLLLATALSLAVIACTVAGVSWDTLGGGKWKAGGNGGESKLVRRKDGGGLLRVLCSSASLFRRCPLLAALLAEAMVCQVLTATLNMSFNEAIRQSTLVSQASEKPGARAAGFVGTSFAYIGVISGALQLIVMPWAMLRVNPAFLLRALPVVAGSGFLVTFVSPGFRMAAAAFAVTKVLDYSVRGTALELVYQPMPDHERLLGKEAIATVGVRVGRTAAHVTLYLCSALIGGAPPQRVLMGVALVAAVLWAVTLKRVEVLAGEEGGSSQRAGRIDTGDVVAGRLSQVGVHGVSNGVELAEGGREKPRRKTVEGTVEMNGAGAAIIVDLPVSAAPAPPVVVAAVNNNNHHKGSKEL